MTLRLLQDVSNQSRELLHVLQLPCSSLVVFCGTLPSHYAVDVPNASSNSVQKMIFNLPRVLLASVRSVKAASNGPAISPACLSALL